MFSYMFFKPSMKKCAIGDRDDSLGSSSLNKKPFSFLEVAISEAALE